jgi:hypothetical protein
MWWGRWDLLLAPSGDISRRPFFIFEVFFIALGKTCRI